MTLVEVLAVLAAVVILLALYFPSRPRQMQRAPWMQCVNNLRQIGLATLVWGEEHDDKFPTAVSPINGGAMEYTSGPNAWKNFQVMSNQLHMPKVLFCPAETDPHRFMATNFDYLRNLNLSFFVGIDANETLPNAILSGDRNITNSMPLNNALLELTTSRPAGWNSEMHNSYGNILFADGHVSQLTITKLKRAGANSGLPTNRLQMPVLAP